MLLSEYERLPDHQRRLSRMWMAARELASVSYLPGFAKADERFLILWNQVLGSWGTAASWSGLHAHLWVGVVAAMNSQARVRERLRSLKSSNLSELELMPPDNSLASAHYSVAKLLSGRRRRECFARALDYAERLIQRDPGIDPGIYLVRGSIYLQQRKPWRAVEDYKLALKLTEGSDASAEIVGARLAGLGFATCCCGRLKTGESLLRQGIDMIRSDGETGHLLTAMRKLAFICRFTGRLGESKQIENQIIEMGNRIKAYDQVRQTRR